MTRRKRIWNYIDHPSGTRIWYIVGNPRMKERAESGSWEFPEPERKEFKGNKYYDRFEKDKNEKH